MATKTLTSLGRHPVNSLQVGQMIQLPVPLLCAGDGADHPASAVAEG